MAKDVAADLKYLWEKKEVPDGVQALLKDRRVTTLSRFSLWAESRAEMKQILKDELGLGPAVGDNWLEIITVVEAWETACVRVKESRRAEVATQSAGLPRLVGKQEHQQMRMAYESVHGELSDKVTPNPVLVHKVLEMIDDSHLDVIPLREALCAEDGDAHSSTRRSIRPDWSESRRRSRRPQSLRTPCRTSVASGPGSCG